MPPKPKYQIQCGVPRHSLPFPLFPEALGSKKSAWRKRKGMGGRQEGTEKVKNMFCCNAAEHELASIEEERCWNRRAGVLGDDMLFSYSPVLSPSLTLSLSGVLITCFHSQSEKGKRSVCCRATTTTRRRQAVGRSSPSFLLLFLTI
jgi:hypothetical protein